MSAATLGMRDQVINFLNSRLEKILRVQEEREHKMLILYRDDTPGAYIPCESGAIPRIVDLELPAIHRRDMKLLMRYPEPRRTATWIRMSFVADDDYIASSGVLCMAYADALQPWVNKLDRKALKTTFKKPTTPLLCPDGFAMILEKQIEGCGEFSWNGKEGMESRTITRGVRARTEALTFPSTNRKRDLRQLKYYKKKGDLIYPEGDPDKRSVFAKWMAHNPLFMLPSETRSPLSARRVTNSAESGAGTEDSGFPGVSIGKISKKGKKGKERQRGGIQPRIAVALGQTDAEYLAQLEADWAAVGGFGTIDGNRDQGDTQGDASAKGKEGKKVRSDSCNRDPRLQPPGGTMGTLALGQTPAQSLASVGPNVAAVEGFGPIDGNVGKQRKMQKEAPDNDAKREHLKKIRDKTEAVNARIASLERQWREETAQTTTGDHKADDTIQNAVASSAESPFSAENAPLQDGLIHSLRLERDVTVTLEKKKPEAGAGRVRRRAE